MEVVTEGDPLPLPEGVAAVEALGALPDASVAVSSPESPPSGNPGWPWHCSLMYFMNFSRSAGLVHAGESLFLIASKKPALEQRQSVSDNPHQYS